MNTHCENCENRGCGSYHDKCEKYQEFLEANNLVKSNRRKKKEIEEIHIESGQRHLDTRMRKSSPFRRKRR